MKAKYISVAVFAAFLMTIAACDQFSLLDMFQRSADTTAGSTAPTLSLAAQKLIVNQGESVILYPAGGTAPYTFAVLADDIYPASATNFGTVSGSTFTAQLAVGKVKVRVIDSSNATSDTVLTVLPLPPTNFSAVTGSGSGHNIDLGWTCNNSSYISGFRLSRSTDQTTYADVITITNTATSYTNNSFGNPNITYYYKLYAVAGSYESAASSVASAIPN